MKPTIQLQLGCTYYLRVKPIGTDGKTILPQTITNPVFRVAGSKTIYPHTVDGEFFCLTLPATEIQGVYDLFLNGNIGTDTYAYAWNDLWERTKYSNAIEYSTYHTCCVIVGYSDAELEAAKRAAMAAKADYEAAQAQAEAAKAEYIAKMASVDDIAKETAATQNKNEIIQEVRTAQPDLSAVAKETTSQTILAKLDALHIDLTPVLQAIESAKAYLKGKLDDAVTTLGGWFTSGKQEILTKIENTQPDLSAVAKETQATANKQEILTAIGDIDSGASMQDIQAALNALQAAIKGNNTSATITATLQVVNAIQSSQLTDSDKQDILNAIQQAAPTIDFTQVLNAISESENAIIQAMPSVNGLALETTVQETRAIAEEAKDAVEGMSIPTKTEIANEVEKKLPTNYSKEVTLTNGIAEIKQAVEDIDLSTVAKQGTNPNVTLTTIDAKLNNIQLATEAEIDSI